MASTSPVHQGVGYLEEFIRAVRAVRERLESAEDVDAAAHGIEEAARVEDELEALARGVDRSGEDARESFASAGEELADLSRELDEQRRESLGAEQERQHERREEWEAEEEEIAEQVAAEVAEVREAAAELLEDLGELHEALEDEKEELKAEASEDKEQTIEDAVAIVQHVRASITDLELELVALAAAAQAARTVELCERVFAVAADAAVRGVLTFDPAGVPLAMTAAAVSQVLAETTGSRDSSLGLRAGVSAVVDAAGASASQASTAAGLVATALEEAMNALRGGEAMSRDLAPLLPAVSVVEGLAENVQRLLSALNPFD
jgi:hypothetical protein